MGLAFGVRSDVSIARSSVAPRKWNSPERTVAIWGGLGAGAAGRHAACLGPKMVGPSCPVRSCPVRRPDYVGHRLTGAPAAT